MGTILCGGVHCWSFCGSLWGNFSSATWGSLYTLKKPGGSVFMKQNICTFRAPMQGVLTVHRKKNSSFMEPKGNPDPYPLYISPMIQTCIYEELEAKLTRRSYTNNWRLDKLSHKSRININFVFYSPSFSMLYVVLNSLAFIFVHITHEHQLFWFCFVFFNCQLLVTSFFNLLNYVEGWLYVWWNIGYCDFRTSSVQTCFYWMWS